MEWPGRRLGHHVCNGEFRKILQPKKGRELMTTTRDELLNGFLGKDNDYGSLDFFKRHIPEIDWGHKNTWEDFGEKYSYDTAPPALSEQLHQSRTKSEYTRTYMTFSGADIVALFNGEIIGELQGVSKDVNGNGDGYIDLVMTRFETDIIPGPDTLIVLAYANEYGNMAYEVLKLEHLLRMKNEVSIDGLCFSNYLRYKGKLIKPMTPGTDRMRYMTKENFASLVKKLRGIPELKKYLPESNEMPKNNYAMRAYYCALEALHEDKKA